MPLAGQIEAARADGRWRRGFVPVREAESGYGRDLPASRLPLLKRGQTVQVWDRALREVPWRTLNTHNSQPRVLKEALPFWQLL